MLISTDLLRQFDPISLEDMDRVKLMNRIDTKFVTNVESLKELLNSAVGDYRIQKIDDGINMPYYTRYYDTIDNNMFYEHQRGKKTRQKIRIRSYENTDNNSFLEIKSKDNKGRTIKRRVMVPKYGSPSNYSDFIEENSLYKALALHAKIENRFFRITLVNKALTERITIDTNLFFHNLVTGNEKSLENLVIIEWKRGDSLSTSRFGRLLRDLRIKPTGFSKYCMGMAFTDNKIRQNRLKAKIRHINKYNDTNL